MSENYAAQKAIPVALIKIDANSPHLLESAVEDLISAASLKVKLGEKILVKPNLLKANPLACTDPHFVAVVCQKLLDLGADVIVADSPGFGTCSSVAASIGLVDALAPLGLKVSSFEKVVWQKLPMEGHPRLPIARLALEVDQIFSLPRVKAHSQMRLTLAVKNCFGVVVGFHKAVAHTIYGSNPDFFADVLAALFSILPQVASIIDGRIAMHITGPANGQPYALNLLGASSNALLLDYVLCQILHVEFKDFPLGQAQLRREALCEPIYPLESPNAFDASGFSVPQVLLTTSFAPHRLIYSCLKRIWAALF
ncbi:MAG: DUF362 domain-containing protein [Desulfovibrionaceae bacterium]|nr:DUF362 domain-containing protein [Desulfovibrionaceae bacterium]